MQPFRIHEEHPDHFVLENHTGAFRVAKRGLSPEFMARIRAQGREGFHQGPAPYRILRELPDHFVIQHRTGTSRVFKQGLSPAYIARLRIEGQAPAPPELLAETRDEFVLRSAGSVFRVPKSQLTPAQVQQFRGYSWGDPVQRFDEGGGVETTDQPQADAGPPDGAAPAVSFDVDGGTADNAGAAGPSPVAQSLTPAPPDGASPQPDAADGGAADAGTGMDGKAHPGRQTFQLNRPESDVLSKGPYLNANGKAQCVELVQRNSGAPSTPQWLPGQKVWGSQEGSIPRGTAIATFDEGTGRYPQGARGGSGNQHAAIYLSHDKTGIQVLEQYQTDNGPHIGTRTIHEHGWPGRSNDPGAYYVIETDPQATQAAPAPRQIAPAAAPPRYWETHTSPLAFPPPRAPRSRSGRGGAQ